MLKFPRYITGLLVAAAAASAGMAFAAEPAMTQDGKLVSHQGLTLYTFDKDGSGKSSCNDKCAENWPPLKATSGEQATGKWSVVTRDDGSSQWAYDNKPLYTFKDDKKAGDVTGDNKGNVWHIVKP